MTNRQTAPFAMVLALSALDCGAPPRVVTVVPTRPPEDLVVLLADADGTIGSAAVSTSTGAVTLDRPGAATMVTAAQPPSPATVMPEADVQRLFGEALSALPPSPLRLTFYFEFETDELTAASRNRIPAILAAVSEYPAAEVIVIGHTDTTGSSARNFGLGLRRANAVRTLLLGAAIPASTIEVSSRGETELALDTADDVREPRNRRVEITVR